MDDIVSKDMNCRVEITVSFKGVHIMGKISTTAKVDVEKIAKDIIRERLVISTEARSLIQRIARL